MVRTTSESGTSDGATHEPPARGPLEFEDLFQAQYPILLRTGVAMTGAADRRIDLTDALRALPPCQRAVIVLHYLFDLPVQRVARDLRIREGTVKAHLHAGCNRLADLPSLARIVLGRLP
jgi:DNA-directed RNA polymerase specialized sigma24 family protein